MAASDSETGADGLPILALPSPAAWERWLEARAGDETAPGVWLRIARKGSGIPSPTYSDALDVALCFGWIDGQKAGGDERGFLQRFTPRRARSRWSQINREKVDALISAGRMRPAGQAEIDRAKADGRWGAAYPGARRATVPDDLRAALDANPVAAAAFAGLDGQNRYAILYRLHDARRPETRARRLADFVELLAAGRRLHP